MFDRTQSVGFQILKNLLATDCFHCWAYGADGGRGDDAMAVGEGGEEEGGKDFETHYELRLWLVFGRSIVRNIVRCQIRVFGDQCVVIEK